jgi:hypothetical protein
MKKILVLGIGAAFVFTSCTSYASFSDTFDSIGPGWVTDRREPAAFVSENFLGDNRLKIEVNGVTESSPYNSAFYLTQGRQHQASVSGLWSMTGQIYVGSDAVSGNNLRRFDLWGRSGLVGNETGADYWIMGVRRFDAADPFNVSAGNITSAWRVWDGNVGWIDIATPVATGWHDVGISFDGANVNYSLNGNTVYTDSTVGALAGSFTTVYAQAYNFGPNNGNYNAYFDNINVTATAVPEPSSMLALLGVGMLPFIRRFRRK